MASSEQTGAMTNKLYNVLKYVALIVLPALNVLWLALASIWELDYGTKVGLTIAAVDAFLGALLKVSSASYYKNGDNFQGVVSVTPNAEGRAVKVSFDEGRLAEAVDQPGKHSVELQLQKKEV